MFRKKLKTEGDHKNWILCFPYLIISKTSNVQILSFNNKPVNNHPHKKKLNHSHIAKFLLFFYGFLPHKRFKLYSSLEQKHYKSQHESHVIPFLLNFLLLFNVYIEKRRHWFWQVPKISTVFYMKKKKKLTRLPTKKLVPTHHHSKIQNCPKKNKKNAYYIQMTNSKNTKRWSLISFPKQQFWRNQCFVRKTEQYSKTE